MKPLQTYTQRTTPTAPHAGKRLLNSPRPRTDAGFTLVEVLVALVIFSVAVTALIAAQTASIRSASALDRHGFADIVAENQLALLLAASAPPGTGFTNGDTDMAGRAYRWQVSVLEAGDRLLRVTVRVCDRETDQLLVERTALRRGGR